MLKTWKKKWVKALRSGKYKQTTGKLRDNITGNMCCLGVLCDIYNPKRWDYRNVGNDVMYNGLDPYDNVTGMLPKDIKAKLGITEEEQDILWSKNDHGRLNFNEIADYIEEHM